MKTPHDISRLIAAKILNRPMSESETQLFDAWMQASESNRALFDRIKSLHATSRILELENEEYGRKMAERFRKEITPPLGTSKRNRQLYAWIGSAAAIVVLLLSAMLYRNTRPETKEKLQKETTYAIRPGKTGAILTLANGTSVQLDKNTDRNMEKLIDSLYATAAPDPKTTSPETAITYHTLSIPAGEEYFYRLDDQTSVWLNSQTELRFPKTFAAGERKVYLKGEAFFEVTKDPQRPFIVSMEQGDIKVYGTRFNVTNYAGSPLAAVLVEGSIGFTTPTGREVRIKPSEKLTYEQEKESVSVCTVDTSLYTAWVNHLFIFNGQPLETIMTTLARWYDFTVAFESDDIRHIRLSGQLYRHEDIRILLDSYEQITGLTFKINERHITITK